MTEKRCTALLYDSLDRIVDFNNTSNKRIFIVRLSSTQFQLFEQSNTKTIEGKYQYRGIEVRRR